MNLKYVNIQNKNNIKYFSLFREIHDCCQSFHCAGCLICGPLSISKFLKGLNLVFTGESIQLSYWSTTSFKIVKQIS